MKTDKASSLFRHPSHAVFILLGGLVCFLFAVIFTAQITAFLGIFRLLPVFVLAGLIFIAALRLFFRWDEGGLLAALRRREHVPHRLGWLNWAGWLVSLLVFFLVVLLPLIRWPYSPISDVLHWDAGAYHFPKAIELYKSGTYWDLSIPFGEYPNGFESLLAFGLLLTKDETLFGSVHALIALLAFLSIWALGWRYTRLPGGLLAFLTLVMFLSGSVTIAGNPWWIVVDQAFVIGKNDLLTAAVVLAALVFAPVGSRGQSMTYHLPGLALCTSLILAIKPVGVYAVLPLWLPLLYRWGNFLWQRENARRTLLLIGFSALVTVPAALWILRNLVVIRTLFPPGVWEYNEWSILNNLTNPYFYNYLPKLFLFVLGVTGGLGVLAVAGWLGGRAVRSSRLERWLGLPSLAQALALLVLLFSFVVTPQTAFYGSNQQPTQIGWRFGVALLSYLFVLLIVAGEPIIQKMLDWLNGRRWAMLAGVLVVGVIGGGLFWQNRDLLRIYPGNDIVLRDQFREPVGVDGYFSAYDFVRRNIRNSVVQIENGLMYYVYGENFSNQPTKLHYPLGLESMVAQRDPQYYVTFCANFWTYQPEECPDYLESPSFTERWELIYRDDYGRVYQRR